MRSSINGTPSNDRSRDDHLRLTPKKGIGFSVTPCEGENPGGGGGGYSLIWAI